MEQTWNTWHNPRYTQPGTLNGTQGIKWPSCKPLYSHPPSFFIFYKFTFEHTVHRCFPLSFVPLFLTCDSLGPNWEKSFCTIYLGLWQDFSSKELGMHCFYVNSHTGQSLCSAHTWGIENDRIPSLLALRRLHTHFLSLSHTYSYTHIHVRALRLLSGNDWCYACQCQCSVSDIMQSLD